MALLSTSTCPTAQLDLDQACQTLLAARSAGATLPTIFPGLSPLHLLQYNPDTTSQENLP